jgi:hypothetical protein
VYFSFLGGSALLHLLAAHPKVIGAIGIAAAVGLLAAPSGVHNYIGASRHMAAIERSVVANDVVSDLTVAEAEAAARRRAEMSRADVESAVRYALGECGRGCAALTPAVVMNDAELLDKALYVAELDRRSKELGPLTRDEIALSMARR